MNDPTESDDEREELEDEALEEELEEELEPNPTLDTYGDLTIAYDWFNHYLFDHALPRCLIADSGGSRPRIRDDVAHHSDLMSLGVPR
jgi:hypothetical protein